MRRFRSTLYLHVGSNPKPCRHYRPGGFPMVMGNMREKRFIQIVLWILIVAFVGTIFIAWGMKSYGDKSLTGDPNVVASVGNQKVSYNEFYKAMENYNEQLESAGCETNSPENKQVRLKVLDGLIDQAVLRETATRMGLQVSEDEVAANIMREQAFLDQNRKFSKEQYLKVLEANNLTAKDFEDGLRQNLLTQRVRSILKESVIYTPDELERFGHLINRDLKASYITLDPKSFEKSVTVTTDLLRRYFEDHHDQWDKPERAKLRHILLAFGPEAGATEKADLSKKVEDIRKQIADKKITFADAVKKYSQDPGSKTKGGELGWVNRGMMVAPFEDAAFKLAKGELSKPVTTQFGIHLIQLEDYDKGKKAVFDASRAIVEKNYRETEGAKKMQGLLLRFMLRLESGKKLADAAAELKLDVKQTDWFNRTKGFKEWKNTQHVADQLAQKQLGEWDGPAKVGTVEAVFEIAAEKENAITQQDLLKEQAELQSRYNQILQDRWSKNFFEKERTNLKVKINMKDEVASN
jgi:peptidyl-prolyl cis-trans isomerase D